MYEPSPVKWVIVMKTWTKCLALLCTLAMVFAMFAGCGTAPASASSAAEPSEASSPAEPTAAESAPVSAAVSATEESQDSVLEEPKQELTEEQQALLDLIPEGDVLTFLELPLTEEKMEMTCFVAVHSMLLTMYENLSDMPFYSALEEATGGNVAGASQYTFDNTAIYRTGLMTRQDWLDQLNMDAPEAIDEFHDMLLAFQNTFGANAAYAMDQVGGIYTGYSGMDAGGTYLTRAFGTDGGDFYIDDNGAVQSGWLADGFKDYLTEMNQWYNEGLIAPDFPTAVKAMSDWTDVVTGVNGVIATHASEMEEIKAVADDPNFELVGIVDPVLHKGDKLTLENCFMEATPTGGYNVSGSCEHPEIACAWLDYLFSPNGWLLCNYGIEHESFEFDENGVPHWTETITNNPDGLPTGVVKSIYFVVQGPCLMYSPREFDAYTQNMIDASDIWASNIADETHEYPHVITLTGANAEEYSAIMGDITTYIQETGVQFITGTKNLDSDFDAYVRCCPLQLLPPDRTPDRARSQYIHPLLHTYAILLIRNGDAGNFRCISKSLHAKIQGYTE